MPGSAIRIGTAGWSIPKAVGERFPGGGPHLERYAAVFPAVEINSSFYRPHRRSTYQRWATSTPDAFRFSVKLPKQISHQMRLTNADALIEVFLGEVDGLGSKLGVLLVQLPPSLQFDPEVVSAFFHTLRIQLPATVAVACEPRHASWFGAEADACLVHHRVARVAADPALSAGGEDPGGWDGFAYRRLHGSPRVYYSAYDEPRIAALAHVIEKERDAGQPTWCFFDNTASGAATTDALLLQSRIGG